MARSENQKLKLLYLMTMLQERTDEAHGITMPEIISELERLGVKAERKSIYSDLESLRQFGLKIETKKGQAAGYYLSGRDFELSELKLLVDAVQAARFITVEKGQELVKKLERLTSGYGARQLQRQVSVMNRVKTMNQSVCSNVDKIYEAMMSDSQITFQYFAWTVEKKPKMKRDGGQYQVSPWSLVWEDENYDLVSFDGAAGKVKFYRVDKMMNIDLADAPREGREEFDGFDAADVSRKPFGMFNGEEKTITLLMENRLAGVMLDRFGTDISLRPMDKDTFRARITVEVSSQFYGWLAGLGKGVKMLSPRKEVENYKKYLKNLLKEYK